MYGQISRYTLEMSEVKLGKSSEGRSYQSKLREFGRLYKLPKPGQKKFADFPAYLRTIREVGRL